MHYLHFQSTQVPLLIFYLLLGIEKFNPDSEQAFLEVLLIYELYFKARTAFSPMCLPTFGTSSLHVSATLFHAHSSDSLFHSGVCRCRGNRRVAVVRTPHICLLCGLIS